jgi:hypothetical protein
VKLVGIKPLSVIVIVIMEYLREVQTCRLDKLLRTDSALKLDVPERVYVDDCREVSLYRLYGG